MPAKNKEVKEAMHQPSDEKINLPHRSKAKVVWMIIAIIAILALIGLGIFSYMKIKSLNQTISNQQSQISDLQNKQKSLEDAAAAAGKAAADAAANAVKNAVTGSDDDQVIAATKAYCEVKVDPSNGKAFVFSVNSTATPNTTKKVVYANNKTFAEMSGACKSPVEGTGSGNFYVLKKSNNNWVVVSEGGTPDQAQVSKYAIPSNFQ